VTYLYDLLGQSKVTDLLRSDALDDTVNDPLDHVLLVNPPTSVVHIQLIILHTSNKYIIAAVDPFQIGSHSRDLISVIQKNGELRITLGHYQDLAYQSSQ